MRRRVQELRGLRPRLESCDGSTCDQARAIAQSLRGSGATFGFLHLSDVAALAETSDDRDVLRRVEGLIAELDRLARDDDESIPALGPEWLARAAGLADASSVVGATSIADAWSTVGARAGLDAFELARRVAGHFRIEVADLTSPSRAAQRLVPEALAASARVVPLREDSRTIRIGTADPTALASELDLERLTGRRPVFAVAPPEALDHALSALYGEDNGAGRASAPVPVAARGSGSGSPEGRRVLVVDDEQGARLLVRTLLEKRGYGVAEANDGLEALELARTEPSFSLVVADLNMPRMDGLELIWELRDAREGGYLPVIVVTGEVDEILETQLMEEGADDYVRKPIDPRLFLARVEATIRRALD